MLLDCVAEVVNCSDPESEGEELRLELRDGVLWVGFTIPLELLHSSSLSSIRHSSPSMTGIVSMVPACTVVLEDEGIGWGHIWTRHCWHNETG